MENTEHTHRRVYHIIVEGRLEPSWSERLAGMTVMPMEHQASGTARTLLMGPVHDQAELTGVLNALYNLHLPLLNVGVLDEGHSLKKEHNPGDTP